MVNKPANGSPDRPEKRRTFTTRSTYSNLISGLKKLSLGDCVVDFGLKDVEEAFSADLLTGFRPFKDRTRLCT